MTNWGSQSAMRKYYRSPEPPVAIDTTPHLNPLPLMGEEIFGILFILLFCPLKVFSAISASSAVSFRVGSSVTLAGPCPAKM